MQLKTSNFKTLQIKKTTLLTGIAIASVVGAIIISHFSTVINLQELRRKELLLNKTSIRYDDNELSKEGKIAKLNFRLPEKFYGHINLEFKSQPHIEVIQPIDEDAYEDFTHIDLHQLNWQVDNDILTIDLSKSMNQSDDYSERLNINLPMKNWEIDIPAGIKNLYIENTGKPIDLNILAKKAIFSGNYGKLSIHQTGNSDCSYGNGNCFGFDGVVVDRLKVSTEAEFDEERKLDKDYEGKSPFSMTLSSLQANHIELNLPKNANVYFYDLSLLDKVEWNETEVVESEAIDTMNNKTNKEALVNEALLMSTPLDNE